MSTILKALRRLEQERSKDTERPLKEEVVYARPRSFGPSGSWGIIAAAVVLGFAVTWALLPRSSPGVDAASTPAVAAAPPRAQAAAPLAPLPPPVAERAAGAAAAAPVASAAPEPPFVPPALPFEASAPGIASGSGSPAVTMPPTSGVAAPAPVVEERIAAAPPTDAGRVIAPPIEGRASRLVDEDLAPRGALAEIPVRVVRTSWHPRADRRAAWVAIGGADPHEVREGEWVGALEIRTIEPDGILFADGPILVHRRIGER